MDEEDNDDDNFNQDPGDTSMTPKFLEMLKKKRERHKGYTGTSTKNSKSSTVEKSNFIFLTLKGNFKFASFNELQRHEISGTHLLTCLQEKQTTA